MEQPNLIYIEQLANGEESVKKTLIDVIKAELPDEIKDYYNSIETKDFKKIEDNVHRIKHKISIFGLEEGYIKANEFEHNLREHQLNIKEQQHFDETLIIISEYLQNI